MTTGYVAYRLEYRDGKIDLNLSYVHRAYLCFLADRGGVSELDYEKLQPERRAHIKELVTPLRCINEVPRVGARATLVIHQLSDAGRNIVQAIRKAGGP